MTLTRLERCMGFDGFSVVISSAAPPTWAAAKWRASMAPSPCFSASARAECPESHPLPGPTPFRDFALDLTPTQRLQSRRGDAVADLSQVPTQLRDGRLRWPPVSFHQRTVACPRHESIITPIQHARP